MTYYPTIEKDLARAKEILEKGKAEQLDFDRDGPSQPFPLSGGTIYGADTYAAYKLLESFVAVIESGKIEKLEDAATALGQQWRDVAEKLRGIQDALVEAFYDPDYEDAQTPLDYARVNWVAVVKEARANVDRLKTKLARVEHALNNCEIHQHVEGIRERTACAECFTEQGAELEDFRRSFRLYDKASVALMHAYKRAHPEVPENVWPDATVVNVWAAAETERLQAENLRWQDEHTALKLDYQNAEAKLTEAVAARGDDIVQLVALYRALPDDDKKSTLQMLKTTARAIERSNRAR